jgi:hypothetical protein
MIFLKKTAGKKTLATAASFFLLLFNIVVAFHLFVQLLGVGLAYLIYEFVRHLLYGGIHVQILILGYGGILLVILVREGLLHFL